MWLAAKLSAAVRKGMQQPRGMMMNMAAAPPPPPPPRRGTATARAATEKEEEEAEDDDDDDAKMRRKKQRKKAKKERRKRRREFQQQQQQQQQRQLENAVDNESPRAAGHVGEEMLSTRKKMALTPNGVDRANGAGRHLNETGPAFASPRVSSSLTGDPYSTSKKRPRPESQIAINSPVSSNSTGSRNGEDNLWAGNREEAGKRRRLVAATSGETPILGKGQRSLSMCSALSQQSSFSQPHGHLSLMRVSAQSPKDLKRRRDENTALMLRQERAGVPPVRAPKAPMPPQRSNNSFMQARALGYSKLLHQKARDAEDQGRRPTKPTEADAGKPETATATAVAATARRAPKKEPLLPLLRGENIELASQQNASRPERIESPKMRTESARTRTESPGMRVGPRARKTRPGKGPPGTVSATPEVIDLSLEDQGEESATEGEVSTSETPAKILPPVRHPTSARRGPCGERLTERELALINAALDSRKDPAEVLAVHGKSSIRRRDLQCLRDGEWLNDEVINFFLTLMQDRALKGEPLWGGKPPADSNTLTMNTHFFAKLSGRHSQNPTAKLSYSFDDAHRWTQRIELEDFDRIIVPLHEGNHWRLAIIDMEKKRIDCYDSLSRARFGKQSLQFLARWWGDQYMAKYDCPLDTSSWQLTLAQNVPQQMNSVDCGVFACMFAVTAGYGLPMNFAAKDMAYFRRRILLEILGSRPREKTN